VLSLFWLLAGHFVADYPLQSDFMAKGKNPWTPLDLARVPAGQTPQAHWPWVLSAHAAVHAAAVTLATGRWELGLAEFAAHWLIDLAKCAGLTGIHTDQCLHLGCKALWFAACLLLVA
jgi:hypothetical protein